MYGMDAFRETGYENMAMTSQLLCFKSILKYIKLFFKTEFAQISDFILKF